MLEYRIPEPTVTLSAFLTANDSVLMSVNEPDMLLGILDEDTVVFAGQSSFGDHQSRERSHRAA